MILGRVAPSKIGRRSLLSLSAARQAASDLFADWGECIALNNQKVGQEVFSGYDLSRKIADCLDQAGQKQLMLTRTSLLVDALKACCDSAELVRRARKRGWLDSANSESMVRHIDAILIEVGKFISWC